LNLPVAYDQSYVRDGEIIRNELSYGDQTILVDTLALRKGMGEAAFLEIMQTRDPVIVASLSENAFSSRKMSTGGNDITVFVEQGLGDPIHYLFEYEGTYIVLTFVFPPSQADMERTLHSVVLR